VRDIKVVNAANNDRIGQKQCLVQRHVSTTVCLQVLAITVSFLRPSLAITILANPRLHNQHGDFGTGGVVTAFVIADTRLVGSTSLDTAAFASFAGRLTHAIAAAISLQRHGRCGTGAVKAIDRGSLPQYWWYTKDISAPEVALQTHKRHPTDALQEVAMWTWDSGAK